MYRYCNKDKQGRNAPRQLQMEGVSHTPQMNHGRSPDPTKVNPGGNVKIREGGENAGNRNNWGRV